MKQNITKIFNIILEVGICITLVSSLFLFTNLTTDFYDTGKFIVLIVFVCLGLLLLSVKFILEGSVKFVRTPLDIPLLLLSVVAIISAVMSSSPFVSAFGNQARVFPSVSVVVALVLFYFVLTNSLKSISMIKVINTVLIASGAVLSIISLIVYAGIKVLPAPWVHGINFTPTGTNFSTTAILAMLLPFVLNGILQEQKGFLKVKGLNLKLIYTGVLALFGATIVLTGVISTWIAAGLITAVVLFINRDSVLKGATSAFLIGTSAVIVILLAVFSYLPIPSPLRTQAQNFPREIQLSLQDSWKVSVSAFRDSPFWGTGVSTYLFDFTNYKPAEFNNSQNWTLRFDTPINEYFLVLATLGGVGLLTLLSLTVLFVTTAYKLVLINQKLYGLSKPQSGLVTATALSGLTFFIIIALHPATLVLWIFSLFILASFVSISLLEGYSVRHQTSNGYDNSVKGVFMRVASNVSTTNSVEETISFEALPSISLTISIAIILVVFYFAGKLTLADYYHRLALNAAGQNNPLEAYNQLVNAEKLNPYSDLYRTDIAQTNFVLANAIATAKGPTEASPSGSLTDQDKQNIQILLQQSINEARTAVTLSPKSAINWEVLALLYRQISGVAQNALVFSLDSYGRAIQQDPLNPVLRLSVGGVYYAVQAYDQAIRFFTDAVNLKPDYPNAYFNLSVALRDKGDLVNAQATAEQLMKLIDAKSPDYKTATDYLADLKSRIAAGSNAPKQNDTVPPAAQETTALEQKELPNVVNVGNPPEKITTPSAIKKQTATPAPSASPTPAANP